MKLKIRDKLEFLVTYCPLRNIDDKTFKKISTEICYNKCIHAKIYVKDADMLIGKEIVKQDMMLAPWRRICALKEQGNLPEPIFDVYKR